MIYIWMLVIAAVLGWMLSTANQIHKTLQRIDRRMSHVEDWCGQIESEIKRVTRK